ncbi:MAG: PH domain-containing protein [Egibacteraceae bacterium]
MSTALEERADRPPAGPLGGRLHPVAILLTPLREVRGLIVLVVTGAFAPALAVAAVAAAAVASVVRWLRFRWQVAEGALVIEQGLLERRQRVIPLERVQTVELVRPLGHRLFGVVQVRIETVGGAKTEGQLDALAPQVAERLRAVLLGRADQAASLVDRNVLARLTPGTLVLAGLTGGRIGVVAVLLGAASEVFGDRFEWLAALPARLGVRGTIVLTALAALAAFLVSVAATAVAYWGFTLTRDDETLLVRRGLLEQRLDTVPIRRIQAVTVEENAVRRALGLAAVRVAVAGRPGTQAQQTGVLLPLGRRGEALALVERILGVEGLGGAPLEPMPARARTRRVVRAVLVSLVGTAGTVLGAGRAGFLALALLVPLVAWALAAYRALGHAERQGVIVARAGALVRRTAFVPVTRLASLRLSASPLQLRARLATLALQIPGASPARDPRLRDLDRHLAERLLLQLSAVVTAKRA